MHALHPRHFPNKQMTGLGTSTALRLAQYMLMKTLDLSNMKKNAFKKLKIARGGKISLELVENKMSTWETKCPCIGKQNVQMYSFKLLFGKLSSPASLLIGKLSPAQGMAGELVLCGVEAAHHKLSPVRGVYQWRFYPLRFVHAAFRIFPSPQQPRVRC